MTGGGLPRGRPTLVCGPAGCGKTLLAMEFLVRGITEFGENGVFLAFEESAADLTANVASLGFDLQQLEAEGRLVLDHVNVTGAQIEDAGEWDLEGLFLRLGAAIDEVGAKRIVIDTIETLFGAFADEATLRSEIARLFLWLKERGVTAVITGERGAGTLTRHGIEEYVADCVIVLDHRVTEQTSTRRLRILKYRGSLHGTNEYPFLIGDSGVSVLPITTAGLQHEVSTERVSTGVGRLDSMLGDGGFYKGSTVLVSGTAGTGKSTLAAQFCDATCRGGGRAMYFAFEESETQIVRNMASVGIDLQQWIDAGLLQFRCSRPSLLGLEAHLFAIQRFVGEFDPAVVVMDPVSDLLRIGTGADVSAMLTRQVDYLKARGVTTLFTNLASERQTAPADRDHVAGRHVDPGQDDGGQWRAQPGPLRDEVPWDGALESDPRVPPHRPGHRAGRRLCRAAGRAHRVRASGPGGAGAFRRHRAAGGPRAAPGRAGDAARGGRGTDGRAVARVRGRGGRRREALEPCLDGGGGPSRPAGGAGPSPPGGRRRARPREPERRAMTGLSEGDTAVAEDDVWLLRLYVAGQSPKSLRAFANLKDLCDEHLAGRYELEVIDLVEQPALARADDILAIPTLVRRLPVPLRKIIGDLSNTERVLVGLRIEPKAGR